MAKIKQRQPQMTGLRAVTYSRVSDQSQAGGGQDIIVRAGCRNGSLLR